MVALTWNWRSRVSKCWQKEALCHLAEMICLEAKWIQSLPSKSKSKKMRVLVTVGTTKFPELVASAVDPDVTSLLSSMGYNHMEIQVGLYKNSSQKIWIMTHDHWPPSPKWFDHYCITSGSTYNLSNPRLDLVKWRSHPTFLPQSTPGPTSPQWQRYLSSRVGEHLDHGCTF